MFKLTLVTPEKLILKDAELAEVTLPAHSGELNILPGHTQLMTTLKAGKLQYKLANGETDNFVIAWGYCQVNNEGVLVLAENLKSKNELDKSTIQQSLKGLDDKLSKETLDDVEFEKLMKDIEELRAQGSFLEH